MARKALGVILARDASCADLGGSSKYSGEAPVRLFGSQSNFDSTSRQVEPVARKALGVILARAAGCADLGGSSKYSGGGGLRRSRRSKKVPEKLPQGARGPESIVGTAVPTEII